MDYDQALLDMYSLTHNSTYLERVRQNLVQIVDRLDPDYKYRWLLPDGDDYYAGMLQAILIADVYYYLRVAPNPDPTLQQALVNLCKAFVFTTEGTWDHVNNAYAGWLIANQVLGVSPFLPSSFTMDEATFYQQTSTYNGSIPQAQTIAQFSPSYQTYNGYVLTKLSALLPQPLPVMSLMPEIMSVSQQVNYSIYAARNTYALMWAHESTGYADDSFATQQEAMVRTLYAGPLTDNLSALTELMITAATAKYRADRMLDVTVIPALASIVPASLSEGNPANAALMVNGTGFNSNSVVQWNGTPLVTTFIGTTQLSAAVPSLLAQQGTVTITVNNPGAGGGMSNTHSLSVVDAPLTLTLIPFTPQPNTPLTNVAVATFTDASPNPNLNAYQAVIHWGDGFVSTASAAAGTITQNGNTFTILGSHTYTQASLALTVQVQDFGANNAPATATQISSGGSTGGAYQQGTHTLLTGIDVAHLSNLVASGGVYDPSVAGPLTSLSYSYDFAVFSGSSTGDQVGVGFLVKQGDDYYLTGYHAVGQNGWNIGTLQTAGSFTHIFGTGPSSPNFSAGGAPLQFGYFTANSSGGTRESLVWGIDNFQVVINGTTYSDTTFNNSAWTLLALFANNLGAASVTQSRTFLTLNALAPLAEGSPLVVNGSGFLNGAVVDWNGQPLTTTFISASQLQAALPAAPVPEEGATATITVANPSPGGSTSNAQTLTIVDAPLTLALTPFTPQLNVPLTNIALATFTDANPVGDLNNYQAIIHWGDGVVSSASAATGTITQTGTTFTILGSHTYTTANPALAFSVQVQDFGPNDTPATATQISSGGSTGGAYQQGTHTLRIGIDVAHLSNLVANGGVYDPSVAGPLTSLSYSYDFAVFSAPSPSNRVGVGFLVKQGDDYYLTGYQAVGQNNWNVGTLQAAGSFTHIFGTGPSSPNFSASGAPLQFGYFTANSGNGTAEKLVWGLDNFNVVINGTTYADTTFNNSAWTHLTLAADNLGAASATQSQTLSVS
jgi:hypothetical protein